MKTALRLFGIVGFLTLVAGSAAAQEKPKTVRVDAAYGAFQSYHYLTAKNEAEARLRKQPGDTAAMTLLGEIYSQGRGVPPNFEIAAQWYDKAAQLGDPQAMAILGAMLIDGIGVAKDTARAKALLEHAAGKGNALASYTLGALLLTSNSPIELAHAAILIRRAAEAEVPDAEYALGILYKEGRGVDKNPAEAVKWLLRAADNGSIDGELEYAIQVFNGNGVPANRTIAIRYFRRAAYQGSTIAQNRLARIYALGLGVPKDKAEAASWHMSAAARGFADAWLDADLRDISPADRARAERLMRERATLQ